MNAGDVVLGRDVVTAYLLAAGMVGVVFGFWLGLLVAAADRKDSDALPPLPAPGSRGDARTGSPDESADVSAPLSALSAPSARVLDWRTGTFSGPAAKSVRRDQRSTGTADDVASQCLPVNPFAEM